MNAVDIAARGLARTALSIFGQADDGVANMRSRAEPTAAALEALAATHSALTGYAGDSHTVEIAPYLTRDNLVIKGNGAELRNVNDRELNDTDIAGAGLPLGSSNFTATGNLTYHDIAVESSTGPVLDLGANAVNYAEGDLVVLHGATKYQVMLLGEWRDVFRNYLRARVVSVVDNHVTIDRAPPPELLADSPRIGNTAEGVDCGFGDGPDAFYLLYNPRISDLDVASDWGEAWKWGGVIDGRFRDITVRGRNGPVFNAMQECLFDGIRIHAWRKIAELGEGSVGTTYRNLRGTLSSAAGMAGSGIDDYPTFFIGISENSRDCLYDDLVVSSGPNSATSAAIVLGSGTNNRISNSTLHFPAHTNLGLLLMSNAAPGNPSIDCGIENTTIEIPRATMFFNITDAGAGVVRPFLRDVKFLGSCGTGFATGSGKRAGTITGTDGILRNVWCEDGGLCFNGACTNWEISGCYFPDGFENLTPAVLAVNEVRDNDSDANRAARAAAYVEQGLNSTAATVPNTVYAEADFPAASLAAGDRVHVYVDATSGTSAIRSARLSVTHGSAQTTSALAANVRGSAGGMFIEGEILVLSDTLISYRLNLWGTLLESFIAVGSIAANGLKVNLELWTANAADPIGVRSVRIVPVKPGMKHLALR